MCKEKFIEKAISVHGDLYDYSKSSYTNIRTKIIILCKLHGEFKQMPASHVRGRGCFKCGMIKKSNSLKSNTNEFIEKAKLKHVDKYDYSKSIYIDHKNKIIIICKEHGEFLQVPKQHLKGKGCSKCAGVSLSNTKEFVEKANEKHNFKYDYSKVNYINSKIKVIIICKEDNHGEFLQSPNNHLKGQGCITCAYLLNNEYHSKSKLTIEEFIEKANFVHNFKYDYSKTKYVSTHTKLIIICKKDNHGEFLQRPNDHLRNHGCPKCSKYSSKQEQKWLDYLNISKKYRQKTIRTKNKTYIVDAYNPETNTVYEFNGDFWHGNPKVYDHEKVNYITKTTFKELYDKTLDKELTLKELGYNVISIWECDWKKYNK